MSDKWIDRGPAGGLYNLVPLPGPEQRIVENIETGERGTVYVGKDQTVGEAIRKGQWAREPK